MCIPDLNLEFLIHLLDVDVDREMSINVSHLVFVASCDACDEVLDDGLDCAEGSDIFARTVVDFDLDDVFAFCVLG